MEVMKAILERRSCKGYKPDMVPEDILAQILKAGTYAASGIGKQSPIILAITNKEIRDRLSAAVAAARGQGPEYDPYYDAPVVLAVLANRDVFTYVCDGSLAIGNMMLAAHDLGVDSCWIHMAKEAFESEEGKAILRDLGIEGNYEGIGHCVLGYKDENIPYRERLPRKDNYIYYVK